MWAIPEPLSTRDVRVDDDTVIVLRRHGNPAGPRLVLSHGNGLAIDLYYPFWSLLADDFDLVVYDLRNHGWNAVGKSQSHNVARFVSDHDRILRAIDHHYGNKPKIGVFHSVAALATLLSANLGSEFAARVLFDPPVCKRGLNYEEFDAAADRVAGMTRHRTPRFESEQQFAEILPYLPVYQRAVPGVFDLVARTTLRESADGNGYELRCPRDYEAQIIQYAAPFAMMVELDKVRCPTKVIGADPTLPFSYLPTLDLSHILTVDYDFVPETTHFLQLEEPESCVEIMRDFLDRHGLLSS
ncbi:MAG: alpha/beta hydrolase [Deltaproteobacteria bacterium]|nr:alpha/beta hydrolase [Deltaproteobacteria bacterium]